MNARLTREGNHIDNNSWADCNRLAAVAPPARRRRTQQLRAPPLSVSIEVPLGPIFLSKCLRNSVTSPMRERSQTDPPFPDGPSGKDLPEERAARARTVDKLFREHNQALVRFLQIRLGNEAEASELAQEAYVRLLQLEKTNAISFLRAYLFRIAANLAVDRIHSRQRGPEQPGPADEALEQIADPLDTERNVMAQEEFELFLTCLDELPPKCREVFILHRLRKLTTQQVAEQLGISDRMVRKHITRALIYCRFRLDGDTREAAMERLSDVSRTDP